MPNPTQQYRDVPWLHVIIQRRINMKNFTVNANAPATLEEARDLFWELRTCGWYESEEIVCPKKSTDPQKWLIVVRPITSVAAAAIRDYVTFSVKQRKCEIPYLNWSEVKAKLDLLDLNVKYELYFDGKELRTLVSMFNVNDTPEAVEPHKWTAEFHDAAEWSWADHSDEFDNFIFSAPINSIYEKFLTVMLRRIGKPFCAQRVDFGEYPYKVVMTVGTDDDSVEGRPVKVVIREA